MTKVSNEHSYVEKYFSEYKLLGELSGSSVAKLFILERNKEKVVLKISGQKGIDNGNEKLKDEINFLQNQEKVKNNKFISVIDSHKEGEMIWYTMPYLENYLSFNQLIENSYSKKITLNIMEKIIDFMFENFYTHPNPKSLLDKDIGFDDNINRVRNRLHIASSLNEEIYKLVNAKETIYINGKLYMNCNTLFKIITNKYSNNLMYYIPTFIHKDLSIENVLVNPKLDNFMLIDPRGPSVLTGDYMYDLAKIGYTLNGFTQIKQGEFNLEFCGKTNGYTFNINENAISNYLPYQNSFYQIIDKYITKTKDEFWKKRLLFVMSCHFFSNVPAFLVNSKENTNKAIALYLQGVIFLNELKNQIEQEIKDMEGL